MSAEEITGSATDTIMAYTKANGALAAEYFQKQSELTRAIEELQRIKEEMKYPHWKDNSFVKIAELLAKELGVDKWEILGPFGICCEVAIHLGTEIKQTEPERVCKYSITLVPDEFEEGRFSYKDYSRNTGRFASGTIGAVNGMNYPDIPITEDMTIADLAEIIRNREKAGEENDEIQSGQ